jgi:hypothetical protein
MALFDVLETTNDNLAKSMIAAGERLTSREFAQLSPQAKSRYLRLLREVAAAHNVVPMHNGQRLEALSADELAAFAEILAKIITEARRVDDVPDDEPSCRP